MYSNHDTEILGLHIASYSVRNFIFILIRTCNLTSVISESIRDNKYIYNKYEYTIWGAWV